MEDRRKDLSLEECMGALRYAVDTVDINAKSLITTQSHLSTVIYFAEIVKEKIILLRTTRN